MYVYALILHYIDYFIQIPIKGENIQKGEYSFQAWMKNRDFHGASSWLAFITFVQQITLISVLLKTADTTEKLMMEVQKSAVMLSQAQELSITSEHWWTTGRQLDAAQPKIVLV